MNNSALSSRYYLIYLIGGTISLHGLWIYRVALGWYAWQLSGSELWVGIIAFTQFAPSVIFGPIFGVLADRFDRRAVSILINFVSIINMLLLGLLTHLGSVDLLVLTLLSLMQGILDGAHMPVRMAIVPNLVNKNQLQSAIATTSISFNLSRFIGPALAGIIIATLGVAAAFAINGISYLFFVATMFAIKLNPSVDKKPREGDAWQDLKDGVRYVRQHQSIRAVLLVVALASVFVRGALEMLPAFADVVYEGGSSALAMLTSAVGAGAIFSGLVLSRGTRWLTIGVVRFAAAASGLMIVVLGLVQNFHVALGIVVSLGVTLSFCGIGSQILIQTLVADEVRGRVSSIWGLVTFGGAALGGLMVGSAATVWGLQNTVIVAGAVCVTAAAMTRHRTS